MRSESRVSSGLRRLAPALLLVLAHAGVAQAQPAPILSPPCADFSANATYQIQVGTTPSSSSNPYIRASPASTWSFPSNSNPVNPACSGQGSSRTCAGLKVTLPGGSADRTLAFTGTATSATQQVRIMATNGADSCTADFTFMGTSTGGGWGDPHLTTVDGVHYDFQSAGEFTALREEGLVLQTRQSPVPTATVPITNPYTGITHCVAIFTAVAAKLGSSRVTVQPRPGAEPDANSMEVRVDGKVIALGDAPYVLRAGGDEAGVIDGTITKHPDGLFEITDARGTQIVVSSSYWDAMKVWYLDVVVYGTSAHEGTMGRLADGSWLPALPDGSSLGAKPVSESDRYQALYEEFADAWRVTEATSLFDYAPGTNTATFTRDEWPRNAPKSCAIDGQPSANAATEEVARRACANVVDATRKADCVFDVMVTGNEGFGRSYEVMQAFSPLPPGWYSPVPPTEPTCEDCVDTQPPAQPWWCCWIAIGLALVVLLLLVFVVLRARKKP